MVKLKNQVAYLYKGKLEIDRACYSGVMYKPTDVVLVLLPKHLKAAGKTKREVKKYIKDVSNAFGVEATIVNDGKDVHVDHNCTEKTHFLAWATAVRYIWEMPEIALNFIKVQKMEICKNDMEILCFSLNRMAHKVSNSGHSLTHNGCKLVTKWPGGTAGVHANFKTGKEIPALPKESKKSYREFYKNLKKNGF